MRKEQDIRVGVDARELAHPNTGIGSYVSNLIQGLGEIDDRNQYFLFISEGHEPYVSELDLPHNFNLVPVSVFPVDKLQDQIGVAGAMRGLDLDIFHVTHHDVTSLITHVPLVVTVHDIAPIDFYNSALMHKLYYRLFSKIAFRRSNFLLCDSVSTGRRIERYFPFCRNKWMEVYLGCDPYFQLCDASQNFYRLSSRVGMRKPFLLYVGSFARRKNLPNMIDAFSIVRERRPELQFVIVGGPSGRDDVFPAELPEGVIVAGRVTRQELRTLYNNAELLLFTTLYEGFGMPVLEAMACGCPVVTSPVTSLPEVAGNSALYASPYQSDKIVEPVLRVLEEAGLRKRLVEKGLKQVSRFDWRIIAQETVSSYHRVLAGSENY